MASIGLADGTSTATAVGVAVCVAYGLADGTSTATAVAIEDSVGTAAGTSTAAAVAVEDSVGVAAGVATATAEGLATSTAVGTAAGVATAAATSLGASVGAAAGVATATAVGRSIASAVGSAAGVATVAGVGVSIDVDLESVDVIAADIIEVVFAQEMTPNAALRAVSTYTIDESEGDGDPVNVLDVIVPSGSSTSTVRLKVTPFTIGELYQVRVGGTVQATTGAFLTGANQAEFYGRETKVDRIVKNRPAMYDMSPGTIIRSLYDAIGQSDERIGGSRYDRIGDAEEV